MLGTYGLEVARRDEKTIARNAVVVDGRLAIMFIQTICILKELLAGATVEMGRAIMFFKDAVVVEVSTAVLAVEVFATLNPVLLESSPRSEV